MKKSRILLGCLGLLFCSGIAIAQEVGPPPVPVDNIAPRVLGSNTFQIDLGLYVPLFSANADGSVFTPGANLTAGGVARLKWSAFLNSSLSLGIDLSGAITGGPNSANNSTYFFIANIGPHITNFFRIGNFEFPLSFSPALNIMNYGSNTYVGFSLRPGIGVYYDVTPSWSFGLNVQYWWCPELFLQTSGLASRNRYGNMLEISLSALYSF